MPHALYQQARPSLATPVPVSRRGPHNVACVCCGPLAGIGRTRILGHVCWACLWWIVYLAWPLRLFCPVRQHSKAVGPPCWYAVGLSRRPVGL